MYTSERSAYWEAWRVQQAENDSFVCPPQKDNLRCPVCHTELGPDDYIYTAPKCDEVVGCSECYREAESYNAYDFYAMCDC
ncbi:MAG: hypothetical protein PHG02_07980 [Oscillospiraceae bacterium]|nr:hypothetical protein [Oscillospiraceae bacterium]